MSVTVQPDWRWLAGGEEFNADFYVVEGEAVIVVPQQDCTDTAATARRSLQVQHEHWRQVGGRGGTVVFMDPVLEQEAAARRVYRDEPDPALITCFALIGSNRFARAVATIFLGLSKPPVPIKLFGDYDTAIAWIRSMNSARTTP